LKRQYQSVRLKSIAIKIGIVYKKLKTDTISRS
jgi:hypothetical protein